MALTVMGTAGLAGSGKALAASSASRMALSAAARSSSVGTGTASGGAATGRPAAPGGAETHATAPRAQGLPGPGALHPPLSAWHSLAPLLLLQRGVLFFG